MKIKFLGTGAAEGFPAEFCNCAYCNSIRKVGQSEFRTRTQILIDGILSVDFPPEAYLNSLKYGYNLADLNYLLVTHSHMDHFYAHDFILRGYKYASEQTFPLEIFGNAEVHAVFNECCAREMKPQVEPNLKFTEIKPNCAFNAGDYKILTVPANHEKSEDCLLYYIGRGGKGYLHLHDTGRLSQNSLKFLAENGVKAQAVALDCTFAERTGGDGARHMGIEDCMIVKSRLETLGITDGNTKYVITHFSHNANPTRAHMQILERTYGVIAAYDGMEIEI